MDLFFWYSVCYFLTAARAVLLRFLLLLAEAVLRLPGFLLTAKDCCEGQLGVKFIYMREACLIAVDTCSNAGLYASNRDRSVSIKYETTGTGA
nr:hypothetical protein [Planctomycetota bacterium]